MKKLIMISLAIILPAAALTINAQTRLDNPITHKNSDFLFMGKNGMDGTAISGLGACIATGSPRTPMARIFERWITDISEVSALKMFDMGRCDLVGFHVEDKPARKWRNVDSFKEYAAGNTMYKVETDKLILVKKFGGEIYYVVAAKSSAPHDFNQLNICGPPPIIQRLFKSRKPKANSVESSYCHTLQQQIDKVKTPTKYAAHMKRVSAVLFTEADYKAQKKKGLFKNQSVYTFDGGDTIEPVKEDG